MNRIEPTVGRVVLYHVPDAKEPLAATVAAVNEDGTINIGYLDSVGTHHAQQGVKLVQPAELPPDGGNFYCIWPAWPQEWAAPAA